jgi:Protein of unknown function (DUF3147)
MAAMRPRLSTRGLKRTKAWEHASRFAFGGAVTVLLGLASQRWGPAVGGLLLGFPAIFPASITLVKEYDGRAKSADDARGARLGSLGMVAFALVVFVGVPSWSPPAVLAAATLAWSTVNLAAWALVYGRRE